MNLQEQGFRFVLRDHRWLWLHPAELVLSDVDCTDMKDIQFERLVRKINGLSSSGPERALQRTSGRAIAKGGIESALGSSQQREVAK